MGKLFDASGKSLTPTHTKKNGRVIRYKDPSGWRLHAKQIEPAIASLIIQHLSRHANEGTLIDKAGLGLIAKVQVTIQNLETNLGHKDSRIRTNPIAALQKAEIEDGCIKIKLNPQHIATLCDLPEHSISDKILAFSAPFDIRKRGVEAKLITGQYKSEPDTALISAHA